MQNNYYIFYQNLGYDFELFHILDVIYKQEVIWYKSIVAIYVYINANEMNTNLRLKCFPRIKRLHLLYTQPFFVLLNCCCAASYIEGKKSI